jgi:F-type H+-transporting ATPase subunit b
MLSLLLAADEPNSVHLPGDLNEVYWGTAAFIVIMAVLIKLAGPAVAKALRKRTDDIRAELEAADAERRAAESALTEQRAGVGDISADRQRLLVEANETAERLKVDVVARARTEGEALRARALADIEAQRNQAMGDLRAEVARLTRGAAEAVVRENLDDAAQKQLIDSYIERVRQLS